MREQLLQRHRRELRIDAGDFGAEHVANRRVPAQLARFYGHAGERRCKGFCVGAEVEAIVDRDLLVAIQQARADSCGADDLALAHDRGGKRRQSMLCAQGLQNVVDADDGLRPRESER